MSWLWFAIILAAGTAVCSGIYREQIERDEARRQERARERRERLEDAVRVLGEHYAAMVAVDDAKVKAFRENRAELKALWDEQYALLRGFRNGDFANWYVDRLWHRNREHWGFIIAAKGRITPMEEAS